MPRYIIAATAMLLGIGVAAMPASAQDYVSASDGGTRVWAGGGYQFLSLPEIRFTGTGGLGNLRRQKNTEKDFFDVGASAGGGFETELGHLGNFLVSGSVKGFWSHVETDHRVNCRQGTAGCVVIDPTGANVFTSGTLSTKTDREADYWGAQAELKLGTGAPKEVKPDVYRNDYFIVGFDVRGIDQDNTVRSSRGTRFTLSETIDTTYTGGYIGIGGEYSFGFIPVIGKALKGQGGLLDRLGLRSYINATAGFYNAETDYTGRFSGPAATRLSRSTDDFAFIGTVSLETRKQISDRTSLSLWTDYEYISSVPELIYAGPGGATRIDDDDVFASRTMLRLNIGLGSSQLYSAPAY